MPEPVTCSIRVPKDLYDAVSEVAHREERSISAEVRRILRLYIAEEAPARQAA
jgi:metal-responsive CopG/Arc/MetJ family transcriptional regulator